MTEIDVVQNHLAFRRELGRRIDAATQRFPTKTVAAKTAGVTLEQFNKWISGSVKVPVEALRALAIEAKVDFSWLATGQGGGENSHVVVTTVGQTAPVLEGEAARLAGPGEGPVSYRSARDLGEDFVLVPRYNINAAAGGGAAIQSEQIVDYLAFKAEWVRKALHLSPAALLLIEAMGDSMEDTISDGDLLLVDTGEPRIRDNAIYVISLNGDLIVKRVQRRTNGSLLVKSDNPRYDPEEIPAAHSAGLRVIGQVVWHGGIVR